jgi:predicted chitinase
MTKRINGGTNGIAHRIELLTKAKGLLTMLDLKAIRRG